MASGRSSGKQGAQPGSGSSSSLVSGLVKRLNQVERELQAATARTKQQENEIALLKTQLAAAKHHPGSGSAVALTQLKQLLRGARPLKRLRQLEVDLPQAFAFPCWLEWQQLPASLEALSGNLPLRLEALPAGRLERVEVTRKVCVAAGGGWIRTVRPRVWSLEGGGDMHNKDIIM